MNDDVDDLPDSIDLEPVRRDQPVEYAGRVQKLGFREGLLVAGGLIVVLAGAGVVAIGAPPPRTSAAPSNVAGGLTPPATVQPVRTPTAGPSATPIPTPAVTPGGPCVALSTSLGAPYVTLVTSDSQKITGTPTPDGSWGFGEPAQSAITGGMAADVPLSEPFDILSVGLGACALEWRLTYDGRVLQEQRNPGMDPAVAQQGYFTFVRPATLQPTGLLRIDLHFKAGWTTSSWLLSFVPAPIPPAIVVQGDRFVNAVAMCGFSIHLTNGTFATENCSNTGIPAAASIPRLAVAPGSQLALRVSHASLDNGDVSCGHITGKPPVFTADSACDTGMIDSSVEDFAFAAPSGIGVWVLQLNACVTRQSGQVCGSWFVRIDTRPSATPSPAASGSPTPTSSAPQGVGP